MNPKYLKIERKHTAAEIAAERERIASLRCEYCGSHGHKANACPVKKNDRSRK
jgi:hypothetical protein